MSSNTVGAIVTTLPFKKVCAYSNTLCPLRLNVFCKAQSDHVYSATSCKQVRSEHAIAYLGCLVYMHCVNIPNGRRLLRFGYKAGEHSSQLPYCTHPTSGTSCSMGVLWYTDFVVVLLRNGHLLSSESSI
jgi:hypothetical protein